MAVVLLALVGAVFGAGIVRGVVQGAREGVRRDLVALSHTRKVTERLAELSATPAY